MEYMEYMEDMEEKASHLFEDSLDKLSQIEFFFSTSNSAEISFESDILKAVNLGEQRGIGLRTIHNGKLGFSFSNNYLDKGISKRAMESASFGEEALFDFAYQKDLDDTGDLFDPGVESFSTKSMIEIGEEVIDDIKSYNPSIKTDISIEKEIIKTSLRTSNGFDSSYRKSFFSIFVSSILVRDDEFISVSKGDLSLAPIFSAKMLSSFIKEQYLLLDKTSSIKTSNYPVIFTPRALKTLISILTAALNGKMVQKGISPLINKLGSLVLSDKLTIVDDGLYPNGIGTAAFDGEGSPSRKNVLFEKGVLKGFIFDLKSASYLGLKSTGSAIRGSYSSIPSPGFRNIIVNKGDMSFSSMLSSFNSSILVDKFIGAGQSNVMAGEFSMNLEVAFRVKGGNIAGRVKNAMISGNVYKVLSTSSLLALGDSLYKEGSGYYPYALLDGLSISAK